MHHVSTMKNAEKGAAMREALRRRGRDLLYPFFPP